MAVASERQRTGRAGRIAGRAPAGGARKSRCAGARRVYRRKTDAAESGAPRQEETTTMRTPASRLAALSLAAAFATAAPALAEVSLERGEYLVRGPAGCGNCHTPQGPEGPDMANELGGFLVEKSAA